MKTTTYRLGAPLKELKAGTRTGYLYACVQADHAQSPKGGSDPDVHGHMNGYTHGGTLFGLKKEGNSDMWYDMGTTLGHYVK